MKRQRKHKYSYAQYYSDVLSTSKSLGYDDVDECIIAAYRIFNSVRDVACLMGYSSKTTIINRLKKNGVKLNSRGGKNYVLKQN